MKNLACGLSGLCVIGSLIVGISGNDLIWVVYGILWAVVAFGVLYSIGCHLERMTEIRDLLFNIQQKEHAALLQGPGTGIARETLPKDAWTSAIPIGEPVAVCAKTDESAEVQICKVDRSFLSIECPFCHKEQKSNRNVCMSCGAKFVGDGDEVTVERTGLEIICPRCEKKQPSNAEGCIRCGVRFHS